MSNYYGYHCKTCKESTYHDINHGDETLRRLSKLAPQLKALSEADGDDLLDIEISSYGRSDFVSFLTEHYGHEIEIQGEWGEPEPIVFEKEANRFEQAQQYARAIKEIADSAFWQELGKAMTINERRAIFEKLAEYLGVSVDEQGNAEVDGEKHCYSLEEAKAILAPYRKIEDY